MAIALTGVASVSEVSFDILVGKMDVKLAVRQDTDCVLMATLQLLQYQQYGLNSGKISVKTGRMTPAAHLPGLCPIIGLANIDRVY